MMSLDYKQNSQDVELILFTLAIVAGASISINPIFPFEFTNEENTNSDVPVFEEIEGDILDPTHPFQVEQRSEELKNTIKKGRKIIMVTEEGTRYVANFPEAGGPSNFDNTKNGPNNNPGNTNTNFGTSTQGSSFQNLPFIDKPITEQPVSTIDKVQLALENSAQSSLDRCKVRQGHGLDLHGCNFMNVNFYGAVFSGSDLSGTDFSGANLRYAYLRGADLSGANLSGADLRGANLEDVNLEGANLSGSYLSGAIFGSGTCLQDGLSAEVDLNGDNLYDTNLEILHVMSLWCIIVAK